MELIRLSTSRHNDQPAEEPDDPPPTEATAQSSFSKHFNRWDSLSKIKHNLVNLSKSMCISTSVFRFDGNERMFVEEQRKSSASSSHQRTERQLSFEDVRFSRRFFILFVLFRAETVHRRTNSCSTRFSQFNNDQSRYEVQHFCASADLSRWDEPFLFRYTRTGGKDEILACIHATNGQVAVKKMCLSARVE